MKKVRINFKIVIMIALFAIGACAIVFGNNIKIQGGIGCLFWGAAMVIVSLVAKQKSEEELQDFDEGAYLILQDVAENQEESEYFGYNIEMFNSARKKIVKKQRKQNIAFWVITAVLFVVAIMAFA